MGLRISLDGKGACPGNMDGVVGGLICLLLFAKLSNNGVYIHIQLEKEELSHINVHEYSRPKQR